MARNREPEPDIAVQDCWNCGAENIPLESFFICQECDTFACSECGDVNYFCHIECPDSDEEEQDEGN